MFWYPVGVYKGMYYHRFENSFALQVQCGQGLEGLGKTDKEGTQDKAMGYTEQDQD